MHTELSLDLTTPGEGYVLIIRKELEDQVKDGQLR